MAGFMYYFLGLERRAKKCLWIRLAWCLGVLTRMMERAAEVLACNVWIVDWATGSPVISSAKPVCVVREMLPCLPQRSGHLAQVTHYSL